MSIVKSFILKIDGDIPDIEGKNFQVHLLPNNCIRLYSVTLLHDDRCPIIVNGERCGERVGHEGKHCWAGGD